MLSHALYSVSDPPLEIPCTKLRLSFSGNLEHRKSETKSSDTKKCHGWAISGVSLNPYWQLLLHNMFCTAGFSRQNSLCGCMSIFYRRAVLNKSSLHIASSYEAQRACEAKNVHSCIKARHRNLFTAYYRYLARTRWTVCSRAWLHGSESISIILASIPCGRGCALGRPASTLAHA